MNSLDNLFSVSLDEISDDFLDPDGFLYDCSLFVFKKFIIDDMLVTMSDEMEDGRRVIFGDSDNEEGQNDDRYHEMVRKPLMEYYGDKLVKRYIELRFTYTLNSSIPDETDRLKYIKKQIESENGNDPSLESENEYVNEVSSLLENKSEGEIIKDVVKKWLTDNYSNLEKCETDEYPNYTCYVKDGKDIFSDNRKTGTLLIDYKEIWSFLESIFLMGHKEIEEVMKEWVEEHYKLRVKTIRFGQVWKHCWWRNTTN